MRSLRARAAPSNAMDLLGTRGPGARRRSVFVGRAAELRLVMRLLHLAFRGSAQVILIRGPAGIGKTRLAQEIAARARRRGARVGFGWCWQRTEAPPLWPWRPVLRDLGLPEGDLLEQPGAPTPGRFMRFSSVLAHLERRSAPVAIVLDDVHLADPATLQLARYIAFAGRRLPLLLVLTQRARPMALLPEVHELL